MVTSRYTDTIAALGLAPATVEHPPVTTVAEAQAFWSAIAAAHTKNLLLKDDGQRFWLVVMPAELQLDLKALPRAIGSKRLRFASSDDLTRLLGVATGAVSPLALANDTAGEVTLVVEQSLLSAPLIAFHPLRNDATVTLSPADLDRYLAISGHRVTPFTLPAAGGSSL